MSFTKITSLEQLKDHCEDCQRGYFIWFGGARSSKTIEYNSEEDQFIIFNDIDGTEQYLKSVQLGKETNILKAIYEGNFYNDEWIEEKQKL